MATNKTDIRNWIERGIQKKATHLIVVCDTFEYDDYPVFVKEGEDVKSIERDYDNRNMQKVMEVYNLSLDIETQLNQTRAFNY